MAADRLSLQTKLEEILGSRNVYYQSPESMRMQYPAIVYSKARPYTSFADCKRYHERHCYEITVIAKKPDSPVIDKLLELPYSSFDRHYVADNLNHDVVNLYW